MKSPAFQFYAAEFLVDENVVLMTNQEIGCYIKLLCYCWREGSIPSDTDKIARLCGEDGSAMAQLWLAIGKCFELAITDPSRLVHPRLEAERKKQEEYRKERSESGKKGAKAKWGAASGEDGSAIKEPIAQPMANDGSSSSSSSSIKTKDQKPSSAKFADEDFQVAEWMFSKILELNPTAKPPNLKTWANDVRKIRVIDQKRLEDIRALFAWANADLFWQANILSPGKLRQKWDELTIKQRARASPRSPPNKPFSKEANRERYWQEAAEAAERLQREREIDITGESTRLDS